MTRGVRSLLAALILSTACEPGPTYKEPPGTSYTSQSHQLTIGESVTSIQGATVTQDFFRLGEVRPFLGRFFVDADARAGSKPVVVLSHDLWAERFASSPEIIGRTLEIDGQRVIVVGIAPREFQFPKGAALWTPKQGGAQ
jgi:putative ABC transport system permease protein